MVISSQQQPVTGLPPITATLEKSCTLSLVLFFFLALFTKIDAKCNIYIISTDNACLACHDIILPSPAVNKA